MTRFPRWLSLVGLGLVLVLSPAAAAAPADSDPGLTTVFVHYYTAVAKGRWTEAFHLLHEQLKTATQVASPEDLARKNTRAQQDLIEAFQTYDRLEVTKTEVDLTSIKGHVTASGDGNVTGKISYDLVVFPKGPGRSLMYRVEMDVGLAQGQIIRLTQHSMVRIDPGRLGDAL